MSDINLRSITNSFQDVRLASMASWRQAAEFTPRDKGGPYVVMQEGYDPQDPKFIADVDILFPSGKATADTYLLQQSLLLFAKLRVYPRRKVERKSYVLALAD